MARSVPPCGSPGSAVRPTWSYHLGTPQSGYGCPRPVSGVRLICFNPDPGTTQGEAEYIGQLAE